MSGRKVKYSKVSKSLGKEYAKGMKKGLSPGASLNMGIVKAHKKWKSY